MNIYVISRPRLDINEVFRFLKDENSTWRRTERASEAEEVVEVAGRICYMSFDKLQSPKTNDQYILNLIDQGHESVLEHISWSFIITGISRGFSHQLVRHRIGFSYSQLSQQYHDESDTNFVEPEIIKNSKILHAKWAEISNKIKEDYQNLMSILGSEEIKGLSPKESNRLKFSAARSILPNATETKLFVTANARAIRHFLKIRGSIYGDEEMRRVSTELLQIVTKDASAIFSDFYIEQLADGSPIVFNKRSSLD